MRLQLVLLLVSSRAFAQVADTSPGDGQVAGRMAMYADDDRTTVVTTMVDGKVRVPGALVGAHALVDAVSSASVDVISAATTRFSENRVELGTTAQVHVAATDATLGYTTSGENDWRSHAATLSLAWDLANKNAKLTLAGGFTRNYVGRAHDPNFERVLDVGGGEIGLAQVIDPKTLATVSYTISHLSGYQGSPYRYIMTAGGVSAPESTPELRTRHAVTGRILRVIGGDNTVDASYRIYLDDWGILSHTVELAYTRDLTHELALRIRARGYRQHHAGFYREEYDTPMQYMTVDRELSTFWDGSGGVRVGYKGEHVDIDGSADGIYYRFADYARLAGRVALVTGLGVTWRW